MYTPFMNSDKQVIITRIRNGMASFFLSQSCEPDQLFTGYWNFRWSENDFMVFHKWLFYLAYFMNINVMHFSM